LALFLKQFFILNKYKFESNIQVGMDYGTKIREPKRVIAGKTLTNAVLPTYKKTHFLPFAEILFDFFFFSF